MKTLFIFFIFMLVACVSGAQGNERQDAADIRLVRMHSINSDGTYKYNMNRAKQTQYASIRPLDGPEPAIEISKDKTSLPDEFETRVANLNKIGERYEKNN